VAGTDGVGAVLAGAVVLCSLLALTSGGAGFRWAWPVAGVALAALLAGWERRYLRRGHRPIFDPVLLRSAGWALGCFVGMAFFVAVSALPYLVSMFSQHALGLGPLHTGLLLIPNAAGSAVGAALGGRLVTRAGRRVVAIGLALALAATAVAIVSGLSATVASDGADGTGALTAGNLSTWALLGVFTVFGFGTGMAITPNQTTSYRAVPTALASSAAGVLQTAQRLGSAVGTAAAGAATAGAVDGPTDDWPGAFDTGLWVIVASVALALLTALADRGGASGRGARTWRRAM
jgi:MFS family permease